MQCPKYTKTAMQKKSKFQLNYLRARLHEPEVNSNRFEISLRDKISLRCKVTPLLAFT